MKLVSGSANEMLAFQIGRELGVPLTKVNFSKFANGEQRVHIAEDVSGQNVVIIQSLSQPADEHVVELLLLVDAARRAEAADIYLVIPWLGYSLLDKVTENGEPIAVKVMADLISTSAAKKVYLLDLHNPETTKYFSVPTEHLSAVSVMANFAEQEIINGNTIVASPDHGGQQRANDFANLVGLPTINLEKKRNHKSGKIESLVVPSDVKGKNIILFDDAIQSGGTAAKAATELHKAGAANISMFASHGPTAKAAIQKIEQSPIEQLVTTNSIDLDEHFSKQIILDISSIFTSALKKIK